MNLKNYLSVLSSILGATAASFYDDPPPEIPEGGTPKEELIKKWDAEVANPPRSHVTMN